MIDLSAVQRGWLVLFFALGTVHETLAPYGRVWFTGQLIGFACIAISYLAALSWTGWPAFLGCGLGLACALLSRNHLVLTGLWPAIYLLNRHRQAGWQRAGGYTLVGMTPIAIAVGLLGVYNLMFPRQDARPPQISRRLFACASWQNIMATN